MTTPPRATRLAVLLAIVALASAGARAADEWPCFQHDPANTGYSTSDGPEDATKEQGAARCRNERSG